MDTVANTEIDQLAMLALNLEASDIPVATLAYAKLLLLDTLGVAAAASRLEAGNIARATAKQLFAASADGPSARILFDGARVSTAGAGYAGATQTDNLDAHDGYNPTKGHIGVAIIPALCAVADGKDISGKEALAALVLGYEVAGRAGLALHDTVADYHTSGAWNALGVATVAARIMDFTPDQYRQALGIAEYHGPRSQMMREIDNPSMLHDGSGWGTMAGITAAHLASLGFTGAPAITVEAAEVAHHWQTFGRHWLTDEQYIKPYPICRWAHAAIDGALRLRSEHGLAADDVSEIEIATFHEASRLGAGIPASPSIAQYCMAFPVAAALVAGRVGYEQITGEGLRDPAVANLVGRIKVREDDKYNALFPAGRWAEISLTLTDGRVLRSGAINARGGPDDPLSEEEILAKFRQFAEPVLGREKTEEIVAAVMALDTVTAPFAAVLELVCSAVE